MSLNDNIEKALDSKDDQWIVVMDNKTYRIEIRLESGEASSPLHYVGFDSVPEFKQLLLLFIGKAKEAIQDKSLGIKKGMAAVIPFIWINNHGLIRYVYL